MDTENCIIIGFKHGVDVGRHLSIVSSPPGFIAIRKTFDLINAVVVEVDPDETDIYIKSVLDISYVEYVTKDQTTKPASYYQSIHPDYSSSQRKYPEVESIYKVWKMHGLDFKGSMSNAQSSIENILNQKRSYLNDIHLNRSLRKQQGGFGTTYSSHIETIPIYKLIENKYQSLHGQGIRIALIDSGISPHPYLPAPTFTGALRLSSTWPQYVRESKNAIKHMKRITQMEGLVASPFSCSATAQVMDSYIDESKKYMAAASAALMQDWGFSFEAWLEMKNMNVDDECPPYPCFFNEGLMRRISIHSKNYIDDNLNVLDELGHGTQMAGFISGLPPEYAFNDKCSSNNYSELEYFKSSSYINHDRTAYGIAPYAELLVAKCYDPNQKTKNGLINLISALEGCIKQEVDVINIGLTFDESSNGFTSNLPAIKHLIKVAKGKDILVISPVGNNCDTKLGYPAAIDNVVSVSAFTYNYLNSTIEHYKNSNIASNTEEITFTAFTGSRKLPLTTTSLGSGFEQPTGTSVAAAIATGIFARSISKRKMRDFKQTYDYEVSRSLSTDSITNNLLSGYHGSKVKVSETLKSAIGNADKSILKSSSVPCKKYGSGILKVFN